MIPPFNFIADPCVPEDTIYLVGMRYKAVPINTGEPPRFEEVIDWEATAKASAVIDNVKVEK